MKKLSIAVYSAMTCMAFSSCAFAKESAVVDKPLPLVSQSIEKSKSVPPAVSAAPSKAIPNSSYDTTISSVDFRRGADNSGLLVLHTIGLKPLVHTEVEGDSLVLTLRDTQLPKGYAHRFGVTQFGTVAQSFDAYGLGFDTRIRLRMSGAFSYSVEEADGAVRVQVASKGGLAKNSDSGSLNQRLSMEFQDISVRDALQVISDFTHQNIVVSNSVNGSLSVNIKDEPWKEAFQVILESQGLGYKKVGNILWVAPANQLISEEQASLKAQASARKLEPLVTELIPLQYANASQIADLLRGFSQKSASAQDHVGKKEAGSLAQLLGVPSQNLIGNSLLGPRGSVAVVTRTNSLLVRDTPTDIRNIKKLIKEIDKPTPQVLIAARIVQITTNAAQSLGIQWGGSYTSGAGGGILNLSGTGASGNTSSQGGNYPVGSFGNSGRANTGTTGAGVPALVNLPAYAPAGSALTGLNPASLGFALGNAAGSRILDLQLQALQAANKAKIISSPKVLTQDNETATIAQGTEIPYQQASSSGATAVTFKKAELSLKVTPHIAPNGKITMSVTATNNQPNYAQVTAGGVPINTQEVKTKLLIGNGQTVVIGGVYTDSKSTYNTGVPALQSIPLLGWLFKSRTTSDAQTELLIFLTPKIIGPVQ